MGHYFEENPQTAHNRKEISFRFSSVNYTFVTDSNLFSKDKVDTGTQILLSAVAKYGTGKKVLDLGCGYGVVGVVLNRMFGCDVDACDVNRRAVECSVSNAQRNNAKVRAVVSDGFENLVDKYDDIVLNPPIRAGKAVIYRLFEESFDHLNEGGHLWIVIRKQHGALSAQKKLEEIFRSVKLVDRDKGFHVYLCTR
ncbi:MAG: class I SAM-dependent methyltransferase [Erysipelotrichaceae bacterium]|nr:class I SAM-dependent methyltransferase [Erysipelotrichaceae bacterium]